MPTWGIVCEMHFFLARYIFLKKNRDFERHKPSCPTLKHCCKCSCIPLWLQKIRLLPREGAAQWLLPTSFECFFLNCHVIPINNSIEGHYCKTDEKYNLQINSLASNNCYSYRNVFQNGVNAYG